MHGALHAAVADPGPWAHFVGPRGCTGWTVLGAHPVIVFSRRSFCLFGKAWSCGARILPHPLRRIRIRSSPQDLPQPLVAPLAVEPAASPRIPLLQAPTAADPSATTPTLRKATGNLSDRGHLVLETIAAPGAPRRVVYPGPWHFASAPGGPGGPRPRRAHPWPFEAGPWTAPCAVDPLRCCSRRDGTLRTGHQPGARCLSWLKNRRPRASPRLQGPCVCGHSPLRTGLQQNTRA